MMKIDRFEDSRYDQTKYFYNNSSFIENSLKTRALRQDSGLDYNAMYFKLQGRLREERRTPRPPRQLRYASDNISFMSYRFMSHVTITLRFDPFTVIGRTHESGLGWGRWFLLHTDFFWRDFFNTSCVPCGNDIFFFLIGF